jgi:hypothetical protein
VHLLKEVIIKKHIFLLSYTAHSIGTKHHFKKDIYYNL